MKKLMFLLSILAVGAFATACGDDSSGQECGDGTVQMDGVCVPDPAEERTCGAGTVLDGNECVPENTVDPVECGPGTTEVDGTCEPDVACGEGTEPNMDGECIPTSMIMCGEGTIDDGEGNCVPENPLECGDGAIEQNGECVIDPDRIVTCGAETVPVNNECLTIADALDTMMPTESVERDEWYIEDDMGMPIGMATTFTAPMMGETEILKGTIEPPGTFAGDDRVFIDFDSFRFTASAGEVYEFTTVSDGLPSPWFQVLSVDEESNWAGRNAALNQMAEPSRVVVIPEDGDYRIIVGDVTSVTGGEPIGNDDFGYFVTVERRADLAGTAGMAPTSITGPIRDVETNATTLTPSNQGEAFVLATGQLDTAWTGVYTVLDENNQLINELVFNPGQVTPVPVSMAGTTLIPDWIEANGEGMSSDVTVDIEPVVPQVLPIDAPGEVIDNGGSAWFGTSVPANSLLTLDFSLTASDPTMSDVQALVVIYDTELNVLESVEADEDTGLATVQHFFAAESPILIRVIDLDEEDPAGTEYGFAISADIEAVNFLGTVDDMMGGTTQVTGTTGTLNPGDTAWVAVEAQVSDFADVAISATPVTATEQVSFDLHEQLVDAGSLEFLNTFTSPSLGAAAEGNALPQAPTYFVFPVTVTSGGSTDVDLQVDLAPLTIVQGMSSPGTTIPDDPANPLSDAINIGMMCDVALVTVDVDITHQFAGDLTLELESPAGTTVLLQQSDSFNFDSDIVGNFPNDLTPEEDLNVFVGEAGMGDWTLIATDEVSMDAGTLNSWGVNLYCR